MFQSSPPSYAIRHRCLVLSDLHLGARGARADLILRFLRENHAEKYLLVGDILDLCHAGRLHWSPVHQAVIDHLHQRHAAGAEIVYVRGNHDLRPENAPEHIRLPVPACDHALHEAADGRRFVVVHGDGQDRRLFRWHWMTRLGSRIDHVLRHVDDMLDAWVMQTPAHRRSAIEWLITRFNQLAIRGRTHEERLVALALDAGTDGVICGHFHSAALHDRLGRIYANAGDWVDSFTALAEDHRGQFQLLGGRCEYEGADVFRDNPLTAAVQA